MTDRYQDYPRGGGPGPGILHLIKDAGTSARTLCGLGRANYVWRVTAAGAAKFDGGLGWSVCVGCVRRRMDQQRRAAVVAGAKVFRTTKGEGLVGMCPDCSGSMRRLLSALGIPQNHA